MTLCIDTLCSVRHHRGGVQLVMRSCQWMLFWSWKRAWLDQKSFSEEFQPAKNNGHSWWPPSFIRTTQVPVAAPHLLLTIRPSVCLSIQQSEHRRRVRCPTGSVTLKKMNDGGLVTLFLLSCTSFLLLLHFFTWWALANWIRFSQASGPSNYISRYTSRLNDS